jgi:hypothetical protein
MGLIPSQSSRHYVNDEQVALMLLGIASLDSENF